MKCEYSGTECEYANLAHEDDPALGMECLAVHPSQCPDKQAIEKNVREGHTYHCACRLVWGDGECECKMQGIVPGKVSSEILNS